MARAAHRCAPRDLPFHLAIFAADYFRRFSIFRHYHCRFSGFADFIFASVAAMKAISSFLHDFDIFAIFDADADADY